MSFLNCLSSNVLAATLLALLAVVVSCLTVRPQVRHALWVLVLVKLVTPPFIHIPSLAHTSVPMSESIVTSAIVDHHAISERDFEDAVESADLAIVPPLKEATNIVTQSQHVSPSRTSAIPWAKLCIAIWIVGAIAWYLLAITRLFSFKRLLRHYRPASAKIIAETNSISAKFGLKTPPKVLIVDATIPPLIWKLCAARHHRASRPSGRKARRRATHRNARTRSCTLTSIRSLDAVV